MKLIIMMVLVLYTYQIPLTRKGKDSQNRTARGPAEEYITRLFKRNI